MFDFLVVNSNKCNIACTNNPTDARIPKDWKKVKERLQKQVVSILKNSLKPWKDF